MIGRAKKWTPSPPTLILLGLIAYLWVRPPAGVSNENRVAPPWQVAPTDGRVLTSEALKGRVVRVNFWAAWCPYCRKEKPVIERFWLDHRDQGFEVVSISVDDPADRVAAWMKNKGYGFMAAPTHASLAAAFGNVGTVPTALTVDRNGRIRHKIAGRVHYPRLEKRIVPLLESRTAEEPR